MSCGAKDVAQYIVNYFIDLGKPVSNLQLQKLLYFTWIDYYDKTVKRLFEDPFIAWPLGPVVHEVYCAYSPYGGLPIFDSYDVRLPDDVDTGVIDGCLEHYADYPAYKLVNKSHRKGGAWDTVYNEQGKGAIIEAELIVKLECGRGAR